MKIVEALKKVKYNKEKIADLHTKIAANCANLSFETPAYGDKASFKITEWLQSCQDLTQDNVRLLVAIAKTNNTVNVAIDIGGKSVTKTIAEWVWRRREYAAIDANTFAMLTDRKLKEGALQTSPGVMTEVKVVRHFDPEYRDARLAMYREEPHLIDAALEIVNATTDLVE